MKVKDIVLQAEGSMYRLNNRGPNIEPWGTPQYIT